MDAKRRNTDLLKKVLESYREEDVPVSFQKIESEYLAKKTRLIRKRGLLTTGAILVTVSSLFLYLVYSLKNKNVTPVYQSAKEVTVRGGSNFLQQNNVITITNTYHTDGTNTTPSFNQSVLTPLRSDKLKSVSPPAVTEKGNGEVLAHAITAKGYEKNPLSLLSGKIKRTLLTKTHHSFSTFKKSDTSAYISMPGPEYKTNTLSAFDKALIALNGNNFSGTKSFSAESAESDVSTTNANIQQLLLRPVFLSSNSINDDPEPDLRTEHFNTITDPATRNIRFTIATEAHYTNIQSSLKPNKEANSIKNSSELEQYAQQYINGINTSPSGLISGQILLGLKYKNWGVQSGVGYFSREMSVQSSEFALKKPVYVFDHYITDTANNIIDTAYKVSYYNSTLIINGDSVKAISFLNHLRFISIPFNIYRSFNLYNYKLFAEPQIGLQAAIPLPSYQLVMEAPYRFRYDKTKDNLRKITLFGDVALRLRYKLSASASLYIKQGFSFNPSSLYRSDYYTVYKLNMSSTSVGLIIQL